MVKEISADVAASAKVVLENLGADVPDTALVLGSGLNGVADALEDSTSISYSELPGFPLSTVVDHVGRLHKGTIKGKAVYCLQGRAHGYEGYPEQLLAFAPRLMAQLGVKNLILTNAAGSLDPSITPGELMSIDDHINLSGLNPLVGPNDDSIGTRFPDMTDAWSRELRGQLKVAADQAGITLHHGTYLMVRGPNFETPAEIKAFKTMGATAVGMSTVPECLAAHHAGMRVVGISSITNLAAGMAGEELSHKETLKLGAVAAIKLEKLLFGFIPALS
jgi:inosine/guanosine/xanthosine phosphorylase family protein